MEWQVVLTKRTAKSAKALPKQIYKSLVVLLREIEVCGPVRGNWPNYGKLDKKRHHCHLKKGNPTYVAVWEVTDKEIRLVEVTYAGTHEKAPY